MIPQIWLRAMHQRLGFIAPMMDVSQVDPQHMRRLFLGSIDADDVESREHFEQLLTDVGFNAEMHKRLAEDQKDPFFRRWREEVVGIKSHQNIQWSMESSRRTWLWAFLTDQPSKVFAYEHDRFEKAMRDLWDQPSDQNEVLAAVRRKVGEIIKKGQEPRFVDGFLQRPGLFRFIPKEERGVMFADAFPVMQKKAIRNIIIGGVCCLVALVGTIALLVATHEPELISIMFVPLLFGGYSLVKGFTDLGDIKKSQRRTGPV